MTNEKKCQHMSEMPHPESMNLHDRVVLLDEGSSFALHILRVMGGWIYTQYDKGHQVSSSVFVPKEE